MRNQVFLLLFIAAASGCASTPAALNPAHSKALNVMRAAEMADGIEDVEIEAASTNNEVGMLRESTGFKVAGAGLDIFEHGLVDGIGIGLVSAMLTPDSPGKDNWLIAWMPVDVATGGEPNKRLLKIYQEAVAKAVDDWNVAGTEMVEVGEYGHYIFDGGACAPEHIVCSYRADPKLFARNVPEVGPAPEWLGGYPSYVFAGSGLFGSYAARPAIFGIGYSKKRDAHVNVFNEAEFFRRVSAHMPEWAYLYFAPGKLSWGKEHGFINAPVMFHQGEVMYFAVPKK